MHKIIDMRKVTVDQWQARGRPYEEYAPEKTQKNYATTACLQRAQSGIIINDLDRYKNEYLYARIDYHTLFEDQIASFVNAHNNCGLLLRICPGINEHVPLYLSSLILPYYAPVVIEKMVIVVENNVKVTIIDDIETKRYQTQTIFRSLDVILESYAHLTLIHNYAYDGRIYDSVHIQVGSNAFFQSTILFADQASATLCLAVDLQGASSKALIQGAYALNNEQSLEISSYQLHRGLQTESNIQFYGALGQKSCATLNGMIRIEKNAVGTSADLQNKNIVLSDHARAYTKPYLEILTHEVQCSHGSAIGQFDEELLFYLASRGFSQQKAFSLLFRGFFAPLGGVEMKSHFLTFYEKMAKKLLDCV